MPKLRRKVASVWVALFLMVFLAGCADGTATPGPERVVSRESVPAHTTKIVVTSDDTALPEGCRPRPVAELLIFFFDAFNRGDQEGLSRAFFVSEGPSPPDFSPVGYYPWSWYSSREIGGGGKVVRHFTTSDQGELLRYFARRHERGETVRLLKVGLTQTGLLDRESNVGFIFVATRDAPDLAPELGGPAHIAYGKGALNCENLRIFTLNMDMRTGEERTEREAARWLCENPPRWRPGEAVVACN